MNRHCESSCVSNVGFNVYRNYCYGPIFYSSHESCVAVHSMTYVALYHVLEYNATFVVMSNATHQHVVLRVKTYSATKSVSIGLCPGRVTWAACKDVCFFPSVVDEGSTLRSVESVSLSTNGPQCPLFVILHICLSYV